MNRNPRSKIRKVWVVTALFACGSTATEPVSPPPPPVNSNPLPSLTSLDVTEAGAAEQGLLLTVTGADFIAQTVGNFKGLPKETEVLSSTSLTITLTEGDLRSGGTFSITVFSPGPGGGTSNALSLDLINPPPLIAPLSAEGGTAGAGGFTLMIHGEGFVPESRVLWNGVGRPIQFLSSQRIALSLTDADVASPGSALVAVETPPPGGGTTQTKTFVTRTVRSTAGSTVRRVNLSAKDLVYDTHSARIYVSLPGNRVARIEPFTGSTQGTEVVGADPGRVAVSDDGSFLYVGLNGPNAVRRVALPSLTPGIQWSLPSAEVAGDIEVMPGVARTVAISRHRDQVIGGLAGVTVYDDGVPRTESSQANAGGNRIAFAARPDELYGHNNKGSGFQVYTIGVDAAGARHLRETRGLIDRSNTEIVAVNGRVYASDGSVIDAALHRELANVGPGILVAADAETGRFFILYGDRIESRDMHSFALLGSIPVADLGFAHGAVHIKTMVRWGQDGLAFLDLDELFLIQSPVIAR